MNQAWFGVGARPQHFPHYELRSKSKINFLEVITENYLDTQGRPIKMLEIMAQDYPLSFHGVSLNIGGHQELNYNYLKKVKNLIDRFNPFVVSDHLCFTGNNQAQLHNLLPLVYDQTNLKRIAEKICKVQDFLQRPLVLENLSYYLKFKKSELEEWDFMKALCKETGCGVLLDLNNVYVNAKNFNFNPALFLEAIDPKLVKQFHLAGHSDLGKYLFDTHSTFVCGDVWDLYRLAIKKFKNVPTLIEWDDQIPSFEILEAEAIKAQKIWLEQYGQ